MHVEQIQLRDFRSYHDVRLDLHPGVNVLVGANAQGKTNLLEALHYMGTGGSHRVVGDGPLVRRGAQAAVVRVAVRMAEHAGQTGRRMLVEFELRPSGRNRARVDGQARPRVRDAIGLVRSVLFAPEDLQLVRGDPADRRRFLDDLLVQRRPAYLAARQDYERVLRQRNALLRAGRGTRVADQTLTTWTDGLVSAGCRLLAARIAAVHALSGPARQAYADLVPPDEEPVSRSVSLVYELSTGRQVSGAEAAGVPDPEALAGELRDGLAAVADTERERGTTLVGPHRDELGLHVGALPAKGYASHGESWSLALALRLASREVLHQVGDEPVVLLDDVFAELDTRRRARLAARCAQFEQVIVTAAVDADVPMRGPRAVVRRGSVTPLASARDGDHP